MALGFRLTQDVYTVQTRNALLANSITVKVGDLLIPTSAGNIVSNGTALIAGDFYPIGVCVGFADNTGQVIGQGTAQTAANTPPQITTAADNTTVAQYNAVYVPLTEDMLLLGTLDAVAGTTALSDLKYVYFNLADCRLVDESTVVAYPSGPLQLLSEGLDPLDPTNFTIFCRVVKNSQNRP